MTKKELTEIVHDLGLMIEGLQNLNNFPSEDGWNEDREVAPLLYAICVEELKNKRVSTRRIRVACKKTRQFEAIQRVAGQLSWFL